MGTMRADLRVENALRNLVCRNRVPGLQYVAVSPARTLITFSAGLASLDDRLMTDDTTLMAYSMSKTITACAVLQLAESGVLDIDDSLGRYLKWQPYGNEVTVRQLLSHTAGLPNPLPLRWVHPADSSSTFNENRSLTSVLRAHPNLAHKPGTHFGYSNIGYWLLGALVEQVTGKNFSDHIRSRIFTPLNLSPREIDYVVADANHHASGYLERLSFVNLVKSLVIDRALIGKRTGRWIEILPHYVNGPAFGGIVGNAAGFAAFLQDQLREDSQILGASGRALLYVQQRVQSGAIPMTLGWHIGSRGEQHFHFKEGGGGGFHSMMRLYKDLGIGTVLMVNATTFNVGRAMDFIDPLLRAGSAPPG
jgi:D-alanyl-D-alanine carboxypeptidase